MAGIIKSICVSERKGIQKRDVAEAVFVENHGIKGDAHAGDWHRQISLLALADIMGCGQKDWSCSPVILVRT